MKRPRRVERVRRGLTLPLRGPSRGQAPASTSETADVFRQRTKENELKRNCDQNDASKGQERHQASNDQSGTIAPTEFRHFSPPSLQEKRSRAEGVPRERPRRVGEAECAGSTGALLGARIADMRTSRGNN